MSPSASSRPVSTARLGVAWFAMAFLMSANGAFRELVLKRSMSATAADVISAVLGVFILLVATHAAFGPLAGHPVAELARVSTLFVALTVGFEFTLGHWVDHKTWAELLANYEFWIGRLWPFLLVLLALTPFIWGRWARGAYHAR